MIFAILAVIFTSIQFLCACVPVPDTSTLFLSFCGIFGRGSWLLVDEFDFLQLF